MDIEQFIKEVNAVDWHIFDNKKYFEFNYDGINSFVQTVPKALELLAVANQEDERAKMYPINGQEYDLDLNSKISSDIMFAIGNDHAGTYYPVAKKALPFIIQIALYGNHFVARNCAINILIDLFFFCPDSNDNELRDFIKGTIKETIIGNRNNFTAFAIDDHRNQSLIESLFNIVDE